MALIPFEIRDSDGSPTGFRYCLQPKGRFIFQLAPEKASVGVSVDSDARSVLILLFERISASTLELDNISYQWKVDERSAFTKHEISVSGQTQVVPNLLVDGVMQATRSAQEVIFSKREQEPVIERFLFSFLSNPSEALLIRILGWGYATQTRSRDERIPVAEFERVSAEHVWDAVQHLVYDDKKHGFGDSTHYDVCVDDNTLRPPKAVFGMAASTALGFDMRPGYFTGGVGTPCFNSITEAGFQIVRKGSPKPPPSALQNVEDRSWTEGRPLRVSHLGRERARGLSKAKKAAFRREHGRLFCQRCFLDPVKKYGSEAGESCIEVHHDLPLAKLKTTETRTYLNDLKCYCANCHRIVHREMQVSDE